MKYANPLRRITYITNLSSQIGSELVRPILLIWPWIISAVISCLFISSPQGYSLAHDFVGRGVSSAEIVAALLFVGLLALSSMSLALFSKNRFFDEPCNNAAVLFFSGVRSACGSVWTIAVACAPTILFADSTGIYWAKIVAIALPISALIIAGGIIANRKWQNSYSEIAIFELKRHRFILSSVILLLAVTPLVLGALTAIVDPWRFEKLGPILVAMLGLTAIATVIGALLVIIPNCLRMPWVRFCIVCLMLVSAVNPKSIIDHENPLLLKRTLHEFSVDFPSCAEPAIELDRLASHDDMEKSPDLVMPPIYLVSAEGGGIRAAYWTAISLGNLDLATNDDFSSQVASLSGVSGGSLGVATWVAAKETGRPPEDRIKLMSTFLSGDFLSPLIGGALFLDAPRIIFGPLWFAARRDQVFEKAIADRWLKVSGTDFFARPMRKLCLQKFQVAPALSFNATDALTGAYVRIGNNNFTEEGVLSKKFGNSFDHSSMRWISLAQAVSISARFPFLSPGAEVGTDPQQILLSQQQIALDSKRGMLHTSEAMFSKEQAEIDAVEDQPHQYTSAARMAVLVDGGYFDNSGLEPTRRAIDRLYHEVVEESKTKKFRVDHLYKVTKTTVRVIHIANDPDGVCLPLSADWLQKSAEEVQAFFSGMKPGGIICRSDLAKLERATTAAPFQFLTTPLNTLFSVRSAHSAQAITALREHPFFARSQLLSQHTPIGSFNTVGAKTISEFSLANEIDKKNETPKSLPGGGKGISPVSFIDRNEIDNLYRSAQHELSPEYLEFITGYPFSLTSLSKLEAWHTLAVRYAERWSCASSLSIRQPPLGWTLDQLDMQLMDCLAMRATIREGFPNLAAPETPFKRVTKSQVN